MLTDIYSEDFINLPVKLLNCGNKPFCTILKLKRKEGSCEMRSFKLNFIPISRKDQNNK